VGHIAGVNFCGGILKTHQIAYRPFKVIQGRWFWHQSKGVCDFLLVINSNFVLYLAPFLGYGELLAENCEFFVRHSHLTPSLRVNPLEFLAQLFFAKTSLWAIRRWKFRDPSLRRFHSIPACERQTDRRTDGQTDNPVVANTELCTASYADAL